MESLFKNPIIRNLLAIALGVVIIINPQLGPNIVIMLIGATLAIPALLAIIGYFSYKNKETPMGMFWSKVSGLLSSAHGCYCNRHFSMLLS